jgi:hypothetical protein
MLAELIVALIVEAPDRCALYRSVHSFNLTIGPALPWWYDRYRFLAQVSSNAPAQKSSPLAMASLINGTAEPPAP